MSNESQFTVFCMENYKAYRNLTGRQVLELFDSYGVFEYLYEFFDVLHTTGDQFINRDIDRFLQLRGAALPV